MGYHERLKQHSPTASELEEQKRRMSQGPTIEELERRLQETEQANSDTANHLGYPSGEVPVMDENPPAPPESVIATPFYHQLDMSWADPPGGDHVVRAFVRVRLVSDPSEEKTVEVAPYGGYVPGLPAEPHVVEARFEDRWGRDSGWSEAIEATPLLTAAESVDFAELSQLNRLRGLLPNENLATIEDARKLGEGVVLAEAIASYEITAENATFGNLAVPSAAIASLAVDKLTAGMFTAGQITLAGEGSLRAGEHVIFDSGGITLSYTPTTYTPGLHGDYKISSPDDRAALAFFNTDFSGSNYRGAQIRSDGTSRLDENARILLQTTSNGTDHMARFEVMSHGGSSGFRLFGDEVSVSGELHVFGVTLLDLNGKLRKLVMDANGFVKGVAP